jgi:glycosidase
VSSSCARWTSVAATLVAIGCAHHGDEPQLETHVDDWRDQIVYQIVVDRFANGDPDNDVIGDIGPIPGDLARHQGGDWRGITHRLDYIERLGATAIWISPIIANVDRGDRQDGYHGYWASDFTRLNPRFGSVDDLRELVDSAHGRDMLVIVDIVTNHTGRLFFYDFDGDGVSDSGEMEPRFSHDGPHDAPIEWLYPKPRVFRYQVDGSVAAVELGDDSFHRRGQTDDQQAQAQKELGDFPTGLRDLDTESAPVLAAMVDTYARWVEMTDIDGFRLDAVPHVPHEFWREFAYRLRARLERMGKRKFLLLGEVFNADPTVLAGYTSRGGLDSVFDFTLKRFVIDSFILDGAPASTALVALEDSRAAYPALPHEFGVELSPWQARVAFADNHDVARLRGELDDPFAAELAMTVVFTTDAIPAVYYGTEAELDGGWGNASREALWDTGYREDTRMFAHIARLSALRRDREALRRGSLQVAYASEMSAQRSGPGAGVLAYERATDGDRVLVVLNGHPIDDGVAIVPTGFAPGTQLFDALGGVSEITVDSDGAAHVEIPPRRAWILIPRG